MPLVIHAGQAPRERYAAGDRLGVGVTTVLAESGARAPLRGPVAAIRLKGEIGTLAHALISGWWEEPSPRLDVHRRIKVESRRRGVDWRPDTIERAIPYWTSFIRLVGMVRLMARLWEHQVTIHDSPLVMGTLDMWGDLGRRRVLLDIKCRPLAKDGSDSLQTWAYLSGLRRQWPDLEPTTRLVAELRPNRDPRLHWCHDDASAEARWRDALTRWIDARAVAPVTRTGKLELEEDKKEEDDAEPWDDDEAGDDGVGEED